MIIRQKCDEEGVDFSDEGEGHDIYVCARWNEDEKLELFEQIGGVDKEGIHDIHRRVVVTEDFIKQLAEHVS